MFSSSAWKPAWNNASTWVLLASDSTLEVQDGERPLTEFQTGPGDDIIAVGSSSKSGPRWDIGDYRLSVYQSGRMAHGRPPLCALGGTICSWPVSCLIRWASVVHIMLPTLYRKDVKTFAVRMYDKAYRKIFQKFISWVNPDPKSHIFTKAEYAQSNCVYDRHMIRPALHTSAYKHQR